VGEEEEEVRDVDDTVVVEVGRAAGAISPLREQGRHVERVDRAGERTLTASKVGHGGFLGSAVSMPEVAAAGSPAEERGCSTYVYAPRRGFLRAMAKKICAGRGSVILDVFLSSQIMQGSRSTRIES
jgi:hypothetical protein